MNKSIIISITKLHIGTYHVKIIVHILPIPNQKLVKDQIKKKLLMSKMYTINL